MGQRRAAIVTGSATGVGAASALRLARLGYDVLINYSRSEVEAQTAAQACRDAGADALLVRADVSDDAQCKEKDTPCSTSIKKLKVRPLKLPHRTF